MTPLEIGICSWSIDRHDVVRAIETAEAQLELTAVQVGFFGEDALRAADPEVIKRTAERSNVTLVGSFLAFDGEDYSSIESIARSGGYGPDGDYAARISMTRLAARTTAAMGCDRLSLHLGTLPAECPSPLHAKLADRVREASDFCAEFGLRLLVETGRESADTLNVFLDDVDRRNVGVNFDAANFVVYGTNEPVRALSTLKDRIELVHIKDATRSAQPGVDFGRPAALGMGDTDIARVLSELRVARYAGPILIECGSMGVGVECASDAAAYLRSLSM